LRDISEFSYYYNITLSTLKELHRTVTLINYIIKYITLINTHTHTHTYIKYLYLFPYIKYSSYSVIARHFYVFSVIPPSIVIVSSVSSGQIGPTYCVAPGQIYSGYMSAKEWRQTPSLPVY